MRRALDPSPAEWEELIRLGAKLARLNGLEEQHRVLHQAISRLLEGQVEIWLNEALLRPPASSPAFFPPRPEAAPMARAFVTSQTIHEKHENAYWICTPIQDRDSLFGVIGLKRNAPFREQEIALLEGIAHVASLGLLATHREVIEQFRRQQLSLVRRVTSQIARIGDLDDMARRVAQEILETFRYYYVAIFTREADSDLLTYRAGAIRGGEQRRPPALRVRLGQGLIGWAAESGERILCQDVRNEPRFRYVDSLPETRAEVAIPLKVEGRTLGVLDIQSDQLHAFHPNDLLVLESLADAIARAIESAHLYSDLQQRARQLHFVAEVSKAATASLDLPSLLQQVADLIHRRFHYPYVHFFTVHPNRRKIQYEAGSGKRKIAARGYTLSLDDPQGIIPWVARHGKTVLLNDVRTDARYRPSPWPPSNTRSELCVPLIYDQRVIGILDIQSNRLNAFDEEDRIMFEAVAGSIAAAIHNADLYRSEQWRRRVADSLREVAVSLSENTSLDEVLERILNELERTLPCQVSAIWLLEEGELRPVLAHGISTQALEDAIHRHPEAYRALLMALLSEQPMIRKAGDPLWVSGVAAGFPDDFSSIAAPLRIGERPFGILMLAHPEQGRYGHEALAIVTTFAGYAAVAIENARLYDAAQEQAYASAALLQAAQAVVSLNDLDEILATLVRLLPILLGIERCALYLWDDLSRHYLPAHSYGLEPEIARELFSQPLPEGRFPFLDEVRQSGQRRIATLPREAQAWLKIAPPWYEENSPVLREKAPLLFGFPLSIKQDFFGVLVAEEQAGSLRFRRRRFEILNGIAQQAALAIQNDLLQKEMRRRERLETEVYLARQIQKTFLPEALPQYPGWELAACWHTARQVGGDFYDVIELPGDRLGLFIADIADKGVPAALFMALTRTLLRAAALQSYSPAEVLRRVNELLYPDTSQGIFVTAVYAVLSRSTGILIYANAGHNPPLWWQAQSGEIQLLKPGGIALGAQEDATYEQRIIRMASGDILLFYTDGVTEAFSPQNEPFGEARLESLLRQVHQNSAQEIVQAVEQAVLEFSQRPQLSDDLTLLVLKRSGQESRSGPVFS
jgi:sigma-B regulation protein RsbU (phosphoserine phosphatase)